MEFWAFKGSKPDVKLHSDFHHLNSSQAMCFNLFFPLLGMSWCDIDLLLRAVGLPVETVRSWNFERVLNQAEGTNFDLSLEFESGARTLFEVKLSESGFGKAKRDKRHEEKLKTIYRPALAGKVSPDCLEPVTFFKHYQLLRNVTYAEADAQSRVIFLYPRANIALEAGKKFLDKVLAQKTRSVVFFVSLEDVLNNIHAKSVNMPALMSDHFVLFKKKYIVP